MWSVNGDNFTFLFNLDVFSFFLFPNISSSILFLLLLSLLFFCLLYLSWFIPPRYLWVNISSSSLSLLQYPWSSSRIKWYQVLSSVSSWPSLNMSTLLCISHISFCQICVFLFLFFLQIWILIRSILTFFWFTNWSLSKLLKKFNCALENLRYIISYIPLEFWLLMPQINILILSHSSLNMGYTLKLLFHNQLIFIFLKEVKIIITSLESLKRK